MTGRGIITTLTLGSSRTTICQQAMPICGEGRNTLTALRTADFVYRYRWLFQLSPSAGGLSPGFYSIWGHKSTRATESPRKGMIATDASKSTSRGSASASESERMRNNKLSSTYCVDDRRRQVERPQFKRAIVGSVLLREKNAC